MQQPLSDVAIIYLIVVAFYLFESCSWVRSGATAFTTRLGRFSSPLGHAKLVGNEHGSIYRFSLWPTDATLVAEPCPLSFSSDGILAFSNLASLHDERPVATELLCDWKEATAIKKQDRELRYQGRLLCKLGSDQAVDDLWNAIALIAASPPEKRDRAIEAWIDQQLDDRWVCERIHAWQQATRGLRNASLLLAFWAVPVGIISYQGWVPMINDQRGLMAYLIVLFLVWWWTAFQLYRAHKRLYPSAKLNRLKMTFTALVSPAVSLRATDLLGRNLLGMRHPLSLAATVLSTEDLQRVLGFVVRDVRYPKLPDAPQTEGDWSPTLTVWQQAWLEAIERFAKRQRLNIEDAFAVPAALEPDDQSYCLRCHTTFAATEAQCSPCGDRLTMPLRSSSTQN